MLQLPVFPRLSCSHGCLENPGSPSRVRVNLCRRDLGRHLLDSPGMEPADPGAGSGAWGSQPFSCFQGLFPAPVHCARSQTRPPTPLQLARFSGFPLPPTLLALGPRLGDVDEAGPLAADRGSLRLRRGRLAPQARAPRHSPRRPTPRVAEVTRAGAGPESHAGQLLS